MTDRRRKPTSTATQPTKTRSTSRLSASTHKQSTDISPEGAARVLAAATGTSLSDARACLHQHATRAEERICEATQEDLANAPVLKCTRVLTARECATVLHGLRTLQAEGRIEGCAAEQCDHFEDYSQLSNEEIDELCEAFNFGDFDADPNADITARHNATKQPLAAFTSNTWTPPNAEAFLTLRPEMGTVTAPCGCLMEPAGDDPDPDSVAFYMCETHERAARALELLKVIADFWGSDQCDAPIWPGAYLTEKDEPIRFVIRDFVYPTPTQSAAASTVYDLDELRRKLAPKEGQQ